MNVKFKWNDRTKADSSYIVKKLVMINVEKRKHVIVASIIKLAKGFSVCMIHKSYPGGGSYAFIETAMNNTEKLFGLTDRDFIKPAKRPRPMVTGKSSKK